MYSNRLLNLLLLLGTLNSNNAVVIRCYRAPFENYFTTSIENAESILTYCVDNSLITVFYAFGVNGSPNGDAVFNVLTTLLATGQYNVLLYDWSDVVKVGIFGTAVTYATVAAPASQTYGCNFGKILAELVQKGLNPRKVYLVGHSLGAQLFGAAGRCAKGSGFIIPRITGLDPSGPLFTSPLGFPALDDNCAAFVDNIHTDPCGLGINRSTGTVDIYPNYQPNCPFKQPGCPAGNFGPSDISPEARCSHDRSWMLYCDASRNPGTLLAVSASSSSVWQSGGANYNDIIELGPGINVQASGNYYLTTNAASPFGRGTSGIAVS